MATLKRKLSNPKAIVTKIQKLLRLMSEAASQKGEEIVLKTFWGTFHTEHEEYGFESVDEYAELLGTFDSGALSSGYCSFSFVNKKGELYINGVVSSYRSAYLEYVEIGFSQCTFDLAEFLLDEVQKHFSDCVPVAQLPVNDEEDYIKQTITRTQRILYNLPDYQTRIKTAFQNEKDVQEFLYPVLKSHFSDLVDEEFLPKVAGYGNKPDFGIPSAHLVIECKFLRDKRDFKDFRDQIAADLAGYFSETSSYKHMIVLIYNSANKPAPANFIADLEAMDKRVTKVILSPGIQP